MVLGHEIKVLVHGILDPLLVLDGADLGEIQHRIAEDLVLRVVDVVGCILPVEHVQLLEDLLGKVGFRLKAQGRDGPQEFNLLIEVELLDRGLVEKGQGVSGNGHRILSVLGLEPNTEETIDDGLVTRLTNGAFLSHLEVARVHLTSLLRSLELSSTEASETEEDVLRVRQRFGDQLENSRLQLLDSIFISFPGLEVLSGHAYVRHIIHV
mmetsp:Transcript_31265/g.47850  ORF Transcript_31265/g.47850 Transcript_31265/m.47850 type:complete len:210 (-) Transcript_31265:1543-2172(-)